MFVLMKRTWEQVPNHTLLPLPDTVHVPLPRPSPVNQHLLVFYTSQLWYKVSLQSLFTCSLWEWGLQIIFKGAKLRYDTILGLFNIYQVKIALYHRKYLKINIHSSGIIMTYTERHFCYIEIQSNNNIKIVYVLIFMNNI